jgi:hypothetical protein
MVNVNSECSLKEVMSLSLSSLLHAVTQAVLTTAKSLKTSFSWITLLWLLITKVKFGLSEVKISWKLFKMRFMKVRTKKVKKIKLKKRKMKKRKHHKL